MTRPVWTKAAIALVGAVGTWGVTAFEDDRATSSEWFGLLVALATAAGVYAVTNGVSVDSTTSTPEAEDLGYSLVEVMVAAFFAVLIVLVLFRLL